MDGEGVDADPPEGEEGDGAAAGGAQGEPEGEGAAGGGSDLVWRSNAAASPVGSVDSFEAEDY